MKNTSRQESGHLRQGAKRVFRRMTKCHSVPSEGSTTQCDAGPEGSEAEGVDENRLERGNSKCRKQTRTKYPPPPPAGTPPVSGGE